MKTPENDLDLYEPDEPAGTEAARAVIRTQGVRRPRMDLRPRRTPTTPTTTEEASDG